ncbi:MAG TPA: glycosyl hydrolase family 8, partial [Polyangiaceae bacterium]|nr:glycosyl hydrolase family 8 [Polyangiaceae bacterium]
DTSSSKIACVDPYGLQQFAMSLIFAHDRWGSDGDIDYEADALDILNVMRRKEEMNGGVIDNVTNTFDAETQLAFDIPNTDHASITRPSALMPAYYELWSIATGDSFWSDAAEKARGFFSKAANPATGLMPLRAYFDSRPVSGSDTYGPEACRVMINIVLDAIWLGTDPNGVPECERVLQFFQTQGVPGSQYALDGDVIDKSPETSLVVVNGITAAVATEKVTGRKDFINAVWKGQTVMPSNRYYTGILQLFALLVLSGRMQVL